MTFTDWVESLPDDERDAMCAYDAWKAGAMHTFEALVARGFIDDSYASLARGEIADILDGE